MYFDTFEEHRYDSQIRYKKAEEKRCTHTCGIFVPFPFHHDIFTLFFSKLYYMPIILSLSPPTCNDKFFGIPLSFIIVEAVVFCTCSIASLNC